MKVVVYVQERCGTNPGHMVVGQEPKGGTASYYGFRFDLADLPPEFQPQDKWFDYLFDNTVPGLIKDETERVFYLMAEKEKLYWKHAACTVEILAILPPIAEWKPHARYSFEPTKHHTDAAPCYNCVTWAVKIANTLSPAMLAAVEKGRIKHVIKQLNAPLSGDDTNG